MPDNVSPWMFGNTTVRNPLRLKPGLEALVEAGYSGRMWGRANEVLIAEVLGVAGIATEGAEDVSLGRKWRSALDKMGFVVPRLSPAIRGRFESDPGSESSITENGDRLIRSVSLPAEQEVFLRAIAAIASPVPTVASPATFFPLRFVLDVIAELGERGLDDTLGVTEIAGAVQLGTAHGDVNSVVDKIEDFRNRRSSATNKNRFDRTWVEDAALRSTVSGSSLLDYADLNLRYLRATGLFRSRGRGIRLADEKQQLVEAMRATPFVSLDADDYFRALMAGATLPTDSLDIALRELDALKAAAHARRLTVDGSAWDLETPAGVALARYEVEDAIFGDREGEFALAQPGKVDEILAVLDLIERGQSEGRAGEVEVFAPKREHPAYFEWALWRLFLALGDAITEPSLIRRFKIDQDFLPIAPAPGGGADVNAEFPTFMLVGEATLMTGSRQEAAEGEPVRRHVADVVEREGPEGKDVFGLFVARRVDTNTAETFRIGVWYLPGDVRLALDLVPLELRQLIGIVRALTSAGELTSAGFRAELEKVVVARNDSGGAPEWKRAINDLFG